MLLRIDRLVELSSTIRTRRPFRLAEREGRARSTGSIGNFALKVKVLPSPGTLWTLSSPSIIPASWDEIASPRPVPP